MWRYVLVFVGAVLVLWTLVTMFTQVQPGERAVVRRFGRILDERPGPGLYHGVPWGVERVERVAVGMVKRITVGHTGKGDEDAAIAPAGQLLTGDHNLVNVQAEVYYRVIEDQADRYVLNADRVEPLLARLAEVVLAEWIAGRTVDVVLTHGKQELPTHLRTELQERIARYELGVEVERTSIVKLYPPDEVKDAFERVWQAENAKQTEVNRAEQEADRRERETRADIERLQNQTAAYGREQKLQAQAEAETFRKRLAQYRTLAARDPEYINTLWVDEMTRIYAKMQEAGRIDLLDHYLSKEGLSITQFPLQPRKKQ